MIVFEMCRQKTLGRIKIYVFFCPACLDPIKPGHRSTMDERGDLRRIGPLFSGQVWMGKSQTLKELTIQQVLGIPIATQIKITVLFLTCYNVNNREKGRTKRRLANNPLLDQTAILFFFIG